MRADAGPALVDEVLACQRFDRFGKNGQVSSAMAHTNRCAKAQRENLGEIREM